MAFTHPSVRSRRTKAQGARRLGAFAVTAGPERLAASGKFVACRLKAEAAFVRSPDASKRATSIGRCALKLALSCAKADGKYGASCPTTEGLGGFAADLAECTDRTTAARGGGTFGPGGSSSCGNGTIDTETCDGGDPGGQRCSSLGLGTGTLAAESQPAMGGVACGKLEQGAVAGARGPQQLVARRRHGSCRMVERARRAAARRDAVRECRDECSAGDGRRRLLASPDPQHGARARSMVSRRTT